MAFAKTRKLPINAKSTVADPLSGADYVHAVAIDLGFEYVDLMRAGTTRAFWDAFRRLATENDVERQHRKPRARLSPPLLRLCPECIDQDIELYGCAYFHRAHHLKSIACPHHGYRLQDSCGSCALPIRSASEPTLVPTRCACGSNISASLKREQCHPNWQAFAVFSLAALNAKMGDLDMDHLVPLAICSAIDKYKLPIERSLYAVLLNSFGDVGFRLLVARYGDQAGGAPNLEKNLSAAQLTPNLAIAVLVGCGITFASAVKAVQEQKALDPSERLVPRGSRGARQFYYPKDVDDARHLATDFGLPPELRLRRPFVFWMLFLCDRKWLYDWIHQDNPKSASHWDEPPSTTQDRNLVDAEGSRHLRQAARARAYTRDREWLESYDATRVQAVDRAAVLIDQLIAAKQAHFAEHGRPSKWTVALAAKRLRIPHKTLAAFARRNDVIRLLVPESASAYTTRIIDWAVEKTFSDGEVPTPYTVKRLTGITGKGWERVMREISSAIDARALFLSVRDGLST